MRVASGQLQDSTRRMGDYVCFALLAVSAQYLRRAGGSLYSLQLWRGTIPRGEALFEKKQSSQQTQTPNAQTTQYRIQDTGRPQCATLSRETLERERLDY